MIILITGASLTGKTLLAQRMLEEYKMPYVSIDHLKNHASDIETRLYDVDFTSESLKEDNHYYINGFAQYGEQVMLIDTDYEDMIKSILGR